LSLSSATVLLSLAPPRRRDDTPVARRFLILHGIENHRPPEHWQHWLAERLRGAGEQVQYPQLPVPDAPRYADWESLLHDELRLMGDGERIVVCHSLGSTLWLRAAPQPPVDRVLLVAPPGRQVTVRVAPSFAAERIDPAAAARAARQTTIVCSDEDPYNPTADTAALAGPLGASRRVIAGAGHLSVDDGYGPWPAVEAWCLDPASAAF
jgi:predicted alpha/beta hydrolase family esterase